MVVLAFDTFSRMAAYHIVGSHVIVAITYYSGYTDVLIDVVSQLKINSWQYSESSINKFF